MENEAVTAMALRIARIAGQAPRIRWKRNRGRKRRTIEQAVDIARENGVKIPEDVVFFEAEPGELRGSLNELFSGSEMETARGPELREHPDGCVYWRDHYHSRTHKIPFKIHPEVLVSDEAIVGTFEHEMVELAEFREVFRRSRRWRMDATDYGLQAAPDNPGNFHDRAWDAADTAVQRMREARR
jgi:hypothetical protein